MARPVPRKEVPDPLAVTVVNKSYKQVEANTDPFDPLYVTLAGYTVRVLINPKQQGYDYTKQNSIDHSLSPFRFTFRTVCKTQKLNQNITGITRQNIPNILLAISEKYAYGFTTPDMTFRHLLLN